MIIVGYSYNIIMIIVIVCYSYTPQSYNMVNL